jgi:uncharacterized membrane protein YkoI
MNPARRWLVTGAIAGGAMLGAAGIASAATGSSTTAASTASSTASAATAAAATNPNPATVTHGPGETLLTGTSASKAKAAALAAVPGATIVRVETDSGGAAYEAHMEKADGSFVTVKLDSSFKVIATQDGFGAGSAAAPNAATGA